MEDIVSPVPAFSTKPNLSFNVCCLQNNEHLSYSHVMRSPMSHLWTRDRSNSETLGQPLSGSCQGQTASVVTMTGGEWWATVRGIMRELAAVVTVVLPTRFSPDRGRRCGRRACSAGPVCLGWCWTWVRCCWGSLSTPPVSQDENERTLRPFC